MVIVEFTSDDSLVERPESVLAIFSFDVWCAIFELTLDTSIGVVGWCDGAG